MAQEGRAEAIFAPPDDPMAHTWRLDELPLFDFQFFAREATASTSAEPRA